MYVNSFELGQNIIMADCFNVIVCVFLLTVKRTAKWYITEKYMYVNSFESYYGDNRMKSKPIHMYDKHTF